MFLQNITPGLIQTQGTNIGEAIDLASKSFTQQENVGRAIIVITDGENHEPGAQEAATAANKKGINVFILGIGNTKGVDNTGYRMSRLGTWTIWFGPMLPFGASCFTFNATPRADANMPSPRW